MLLSMAMALAGILAFRFLSVSPLPEVEFPTIAVYASWPGASPDVMASSVATPLEREFGRIAGVNEMVSTSFRGSTTITLQFDLDRNIDAAARDVQASIAAAGADLPVLPSNPYYRKLNPADAPIMFLALSSDTIPISHVFEEASTILQQKISQVGGVGNVLMGGGSNPAVRVDLNPTALNKFGVGLDQVRSMLIAASVNKPKGQVSDGRQAWQFTATDQLFTAADYRKLILAYRKGATLRLSDVAEVEDSVEDLRINGLYEGKPAILINIFREPGANIIDTVERILERLPQLRASLSKGIKMVVPMHRATPIRASLREVESNLLLAILLVILVVFFFLRNVRATIIPSVSVPLSLAGTFGVMYLLHYNLDNLSLMALTVSTGFVVDDAIVVMENITRYREKGLSPFAAAMRGSREIGFTVLSMSVSLVAVFIPLLLMGGIVGRLFREFAISLSVAVGISLIVSLTTTPMLCAWFLKPEASQRHGKLYHFTERGFSGLLNGYATALRWVLRHSRLTLAITVLTVCLNIYLFTIVPKGFFPQQDTGRLNGTLLADQDISFQAMRQKLLQFVRICKEDPGIDNVEAFTGVAGSSGGGVATNTARMFIDLKPLAERKISADEVIARLRPKLAKVPGATLFLQSVQDLRIGGKSSSTQYQFTLQSDNLEDLNYWAPRMLSKMTSLRQLVDVNSDQQNKGLEATLVIDNDKAASLQITTQMIDDILYDAFGQRQVSTVYTQFNEYHVVMEVAPKYWQNPQSLNDIYVLSKASAEVPLGAFAHFETRLTPLAVNHQGLFPSVTFSFNLPANVALGDAVEAITELARKMGTPSSIRTSFMGTAQVFQASLASEPPLILLSLLTVYIVLGILYESLIHPITILSTLPSAGVGAILALLWTKTELNVMSMIGLILLIGIVKKNAIMMIDFALEAERKEGKSPEEAILEACLLRFRPIMMTTLAALLGGLPLALGGGIGSELRRPLGIAIVGGLIASQILTLFTTPIVYLYLDRLRLQMARWRFRGELRKSIPEQ
jgi:multidrug efflux pump